MGARECLHSFLFLGGGVLRCAITCAVNFYNSGVVSHDRRIGPMSQIELQRVVKNCIATSILLLFEIKNIFFYLEKRSSLCTTALT
jgi:hypothetical protein